MRLEKVTPTPEETRQIFIEAFGEYDESFLPQHVLYVYDNDERVAFCSVYPHSVGTLYLQYIGFLKGVQKKYLYYKQTIEALHQLGFPFIMGTISNNNTVAIMWALRSGFKIIGARQASNGELFVEILRRY